MFKTFGALSAKTKFWIFLASCALLLIALALWWVFAGRGPLFKGDVLQEEKINITADGVEQSWLEAGTTALQVEIFKFNISNNTQETVQFSDVKYRQANPAEPNKIRLDGSVFQNIKICKDDACRDAAITTQEFALRGDAFRLAPSQATVMTVKADITVTKEQKGKILSVQNTCDDATIGFSPSQSIHFSGCPDGYIFQVTEFPRIQVTNNLFGEPEQITLAEEKEVMNFTLENRSTSQAVKIRGINIKLIETENSIQLSDIDTADLRMAETFNATAAWGNDIPPGIMRVTLSTGRGENTVPGVILEPNQSPSFSLVVQLKNEETLIGKSAAFQLENAESLVYIDTPPVVTTEGSAIPLIGKTFTAIARPVIAVLNAVPALPEITSAPSGTEETTKDLLNFTVRNELTGNFVITDINFLKNETDNELQVEAEKLELHINGEKSSGVFGARPEDIYNFHPLLDLPVPPGTTRDFSLKIKTTGDTLQGRTLQFRLPAAESITQIGAAPIEGDFPIVGTLLTGAGEEAEEEPDEQANSGESMRFITLAVMPPAEGTALSPGQENATLFKGLAKMSDATSVPIHIIKFAYDGTLPLEKLENFTLEISDAGEPLEGEVAVNEVKFLIDANVNLGPEPITFRLSANVAEDAAPGTTMHFSLNEFALGEIENVRISENTHLPISGPVLPVRMPNTPIPPAQGEQTRIEAGAPDLPQGRSFPPGTPDVEVLKFRLTPTRGGVQTNRIAVAFTGTLTREKIQSVKLFEGHELKGQAQLDGQNKATFDFTRNFDTAVEYTAKITTANDAPDSQFRIVLDPMRDISSSVPISGPILQSNEFLVRRAAPQSGGNNAAVDPQVAALQTQLADIQRQLAAAQQNGGDAGTTNTLLQAFLAQQNQQRNAAAGAAAQTQQTDQASSSTARTSSGTRARTQTRNSGLNLRDSGAQFQEEAQIRQTQETQQTATGQTLAAQNAGRSVADEQYAGAEQPAATQRRASLGSSARLRHAPESSETGPETLIYLGVLGATQLAWYVRKRKKS